jgi:O-acetyl-ADP-ribose deacetylase (regulator of RNase III)
MTTIPGDLIQLAKNGEFDLIVHGCNCFGTMGAGIAKGIKATFPAAYAADLATARGGRAKLGSCSAADVEPNGGRLFVVNAYTQYDYRGSGPKVDYDAVRSCFRWIKEQHSGKRIGLPKIGAGLAGGDWERIAEIIEEELAGEDVTIVKFSFNDHGRK